MRFTHIIKKITIGLAFFSVLSVSTMPVVGAINVIGPCPDGSESAVCAARSVDEASSLMKNIVTIISFLVGVIAVVMIVIGGLQYTTANGDSSKIQNAKNTILYSVVGVIVAISAYAIVRFVVGAI